MRGVRRATKNSFARTPRPVLRLPNPLCVSFLAFLSLFTTRTFRNSEANLPWSACMNASAQGLSQSRAPSPRAVSSTPPQESCTPLLQSQMSELTKIALVDHLVETLAAKPALEFRIQSWRREYSSQEERSGHEQWRSGSSHFGMSGNDFGTSFSASQKDRVETSTNEHCRIKCADFVAEWRSTTVIDCDSNPRVHSYTDRYWNSTTLQIRTGHGPRTLDISKDELARLGRLIDQCPKVDFHS
jgi:hypothetical protein